MATEAVWKTIQSGAASPCPNFEKIYHEVIFVYVRDQEKSQQKSVNFPSVSNLSACHIQSQTESFDRKPYFLFFKFLNL